VGYSAPARLIGQELKVEVYERQLKLYRGRELLLVLPRHGEDRGVVLDFWHVIDHLLRKPGAFERYRYREQLYPSRSFREACDQLVAKHGRPADESAPRFSFVPVGTGLTLGVPGTFFRPCRDASPQIPQG
jgi:hypothetical protein